MQSASGGSNDGLTKQQLELIHQIMEQTQRQSQSTTKSSSTKHTTKSATSKTQTAKVQRAWASSTVSNFEPVLIQINVDPALESDVQITTFDVCELPLQLIGLPAARCLHYIQAPLTHSGNPTSLIPVFGAGSRKCARRLHFLYYLLKELTINKYLIIITVVLAN